MFGGSVDRTIAEITQRSSHRIFLGASPAKTTIMSVQCSVELQSKLESATQKNARSRHRVTGC